MSIIIAFAANIDACSILKYQMVGLLFGPHPFCLLGKQREGRVIRLLTITPHTAQHHQQFQPPGPLPKPSTTPSPLISPSLHSIFPQYISPHLLFPFQFPLRCVTWQSRRRDWLTCGFFSLGIIWRHSDKKLAAAAPLQCNQMAENL